MFKKKCCKLIFIDLVQESEIEKLINNLNENESLGPCGIPVKILQNPVDVLKQALTYLINLSPRGNQNRKSDSCL